MPSVSESFPFGASMEPAFESALRGYERRQVDRYVQQVEAEVAALLGERNDLATQVSLLGQQIQQLQQELAGEIRRIGSARFLRVRTRVLT